MAERIVIDNDRYIDLDSIYSVIATSSNHINVRASGIDEQLTYNLVSITSKDFVEMFKAYKLEQQDLQLQQVKALKSIADSLQNNATKDSKDKYPISKKFENGGL